MSLTKRDKEIKSINISLTLGGILSKLIYIGILLIGFKYIEIKFSGNEMYEFIIITFMILMMQMLKIVKEDEIHFIECDTCKENDTYNK